MLTSARQNHRNSDPLPPVVGAVAGLARPLPRSIDLASALAQAPLLDIADLDLEFVAKQLNAGRRRKTPAYWVAKRGFDVVAAGLALICLSPVLALIFLLIRLHDGGPSLFIQERVGERLRVFRIYKFRTMYHGAADHPAAFLDSETGKWRRPSSDEDPRITPIGKFLRRWALDELPQLVNILRGDMSIVGPRPLTKAESFAISPAGLSRYSVPCGLTGLAQIRNREIIASPDRFDSDLEYVERFGPLLDLGLILRTVLMFRQR